MNKLTETMKEYTPHVDAHYKIGMRVIKTAVAVMICLAISLLLGSGNVLQISAISALVTLRATQQDTLHTGIFRVLGTVIGGVFGLLTALVGLLLPYYDEGLYVIVIPLMLVLNLYVCNLIKLQDSCSIACVVTILVATLVKLEADASAALVIVYTLHRIKDTLIGVVVATLLNALPIPHKKQGCPACQAAAEETCQTIEGETGQSGK